jgi:hypothetical protein
MTAMTRHLTDREILRELDGELSESERSAIARHLAGCDACSARRAVMKAAAAAATAAYRASGGDDSLEQRSRARLASALAGAAQESGRPRFALTPAFAAVALVVAIASGTIYLQSAPDTNLVAARHRLALPVTSITPGATWDVSVDDLCSGTTRMQPITAAMRAEVVSAYGVENLPSDRYELDYLITPELGGATDTRNLWPQRYESPIWNARVKDELERLLPRLVCSHQLDLATAQRDIAVDWVAAYRKYFKSDLPLEAHRGPAIDDANDDVYLLADAGPAPAVRLVSFTR